MKKIISSFLSCIFLLQTLAYSQTIYPTRQQVSYIYNKIYERVDSSPVLQKFKDNEKITPVLALSLVAGGVQINTKEELAALLEKFNINLRPEASILDLYDATYMELKRSRFANEIAVDYFDRIYEESHEFVSRIMEEEPNIVEYYQDYLNINQDLITQKELQKLNVEHIGKYTKADLESARYLFENACRRSRIEPRRFIGAYNNLDKLSDMIINMADEEELLTKFTRQLSVYKGNYLALRELLSQNNRENIITLVREYIGEYERIYEIYQEKSGYLEELLEQVEQAGDPFFCKRTKHFENEVEDLNLRYLESEAKVNTVEALSEGRVVRQFTKKGGLFLGILALIDITQKIIKSSDIRSYSENRNREEMALQDTLEENKNNLFAFLEQLPNNQRESAFGYIAENYFDDFQNQTKNLLFALAVLENPSLDASCQDLQGS